MRGQIRWHLFNLAGFLEITSHYPTAGIQHIQRGCGLSEPEPPIRSGKQSPLVSLGWTSNSTEYLQIGLDPALNLTLPWAFPVMTLDPPNGSFVSLDCQWIHRLPGSSARLAWLCSQASPPNSIFHHRAPHQLSPTATTCRNLKGAGEVSVLITCFSLWGFLTCSCRIGNSLLWAPSFVPL